MDKLQVARKIQSRGEQMTSRYPCIVVGRLTAAQYRPEATTAAVAAYPHLHHQYHRNFSLPSQSSKRKLSEFYEVPLQRCRINKVARKRREHERTIAKLRRMLPYEQNVIKCSELELINRIIDYITSLQEMLRSQENIPDENHSSSIDIANLNRALSRFHLCTNKRQPLRPSKQLYI
uniref:BHLH domain-containing protein n=1 Tax=Elaeophora elaphi TaxID=1147741 RepID=A0A0R3S4U4_9BILA